MAFATKQWTNKEIRSLLSQTRDSHQIPEGLTKVYDALLFALNSSQSYYNPDGTAIHMNKASTRMDFLTGAMLEVMNKNVLPLKYRKDCRFCWIEHMGKVRLSLVYQPPHAQTPQVIPGEFFKKIDGFDLNLYQKMIAMFKSSAKFLYLGEKIEETGPGENQALTLKTTRIDSIMPYVKERIARDYAFKYVNDRVSYVAKTNRQLTNLFRLIFYIPLALVPIIGWALIYILEIFNTPNFIAKSFGPDRRQEEASQKLTTSYYNLPERDKTIYKKTVRSFGNLSTSPISETDMEAYCRQVLAGRPLAVRTTSSKATQGQLIITDQTKPKPLQIENVHCNMPKKIATSSKTRSTTSSKAEKSTTTTQEKAPSYSSINSTEGRQINETTMPHKAVAGAPKHRTILPAPNRKIPAQNYSNTNMPSVLAESGSIIDITNNPNLQNSSRKRQND